MIAILLGVAIRSFGTLPRALSPGVSYAARFVLQGAIIVSGLGISLASIARTGLGTLPVTLGTIALVLAIAPLAGRLLRVEVTLRQLVGVGTAICGASAIAAVSAVLESSEADVALAIATVFVYNIVAVLTFPLGGHALALSHQFGVWAGTAINDTSSVVAAAYAYGREAGDHATIVKLTRATLILPIVGGIALLRARAQRHLGTAVPWVRIVRWFVVWFLVAAFVNTTGLLPHAWHGAVGEIATFGICVALAAIGLQTALGTLLRSGARPLAFGLILWLAVACSSLVIQNLTHL